MIVLCNQNLRNILFFNLRTESDVSNRPCFPGGSDGIESTCSAGDPGSIPGLGRSPGEGNGHPFQYSCLENPLDRGAAGLQSVGSRRVRHNWATNTFTFTLEEKQYSFLTWVRTFFSVWYFTLCWPLGSGAHSSSLPVFSVFGLDLLGRFSLGLSLTCVWGALEAKLNQAQVLWSETPAAPELGCILPVGGEGVTCLQAQKDCDMSSLDDLWLSMCLHGPPQQVGGMLDCGLSSRAQLARISWLPLALRQVCGTNSSRGLWEWKPSSNTSRSFRNFNFSFILYKLNVKLSLPHLFSNSWFYYTAFSL